MASRNYTAVYVNKRVEDDFETVGALAFDGDEIAFVPVPGNDAYSILWRGRIDIALQHGMSPEDFYQGWDERANTAGGFSDPRRARAESAWEAGKDLLARHPEIGDAFDWDAVQP